MLEMRLFNNIPQDETIVFGHAGHTETKIIIPAGMYCDESLADLLAEQEYFKIGFSAKQDYVTFPITSLVKNGYVKASDNMLNLLGWYRYQSGMRICPTQMNWYNSFSIKLNQDTTLMRFKMNMYKRKITITDSIPFTSVQGDVRAYLEADGQELQQDFKLLCAVTNADANTNTNVH
jgi:hypothetical protein